MENQFDDQPLKWIDRIRHGLKTNKGYFLSDECLAETTLRSIFTNIREIGQRIKNFVDLDVSFDNKEYLLRVGTDTWKLIDKKSPLYHSMRFNKLSNDLEIKDSPKHDNTDHFFSFIQKDCNRLKNAKNRLKESLGKVKGTLDDSIINLLLSCSNIMINVIKSWTNYIRRNWTKRNNIENYKKNNTWMTESEWNKLSLFDKIMKRWNFSDKHQCLVPWEEKKLSEKELLQFHEAKRLWRTKRKNELNGNIYKMEIFDKFCHARIINNKLVKNLDISYNGGNNNFCKRNTESNDARANIQMRKIHAN